MCVRACLYTHSAAPQLRCANCGEENPKWVYCSQEVGAPTAAAPSACCHCILVWTAVVGEDADERQSGGGLHGDQVPLVWTGELHQ